MLRGVFGMDVLGLPESVRFRGRELLRLPNGQAAALQRLAQSLPDDLLDLG